MKIFCSTWAELFPEDVDNIIRSSSKLNGSLKNTWLLVVGGESDEPDEKRTPEIGRLKQIAIKTDVQAHITFTGRKDRNIIKYFYAAADYSLLHHGMNLLALHHLKQWHAAHL